MKIKKLSDSLLTKIEMSKFIGGNGGTSWSETIPTLSNDDYPCGDSETITRDDSDNLISECRIAKECDNK